LLRWAPEGGVLFDLRRAGRIAAAARDAGAARIVPGARLLDVCTFVEAEIRRHGGQLAFPVQSSVNHIAAHYCPGPQDTARYHDGDLAKLDVGVHVNGHVVDTALTVHVGRTSDHVLIEAARAALEAGLAVAGAGVPVRRVSAAIEAAMHAFGATPMHNLCGHGVGHYDVHCHPPIPNRADDSAHCLPVGAAVAIEPFATDGAGWVSEHGEPQVFRLDPGYACGPDASPLLEAIQAFRGLPFARRQLAAWPAAEVEETLTWLREQGALGGYAPLAENEGRRVAQAEHTIYLGRNGAEVLTR